MAVTEQQQGTATIYHRGEVKTVPLAEYQATLDEMVRRLGAWEPNRSNVKVDPMAAPQAQAPLPMSTFGQTVMDDTAKARIEAQHATLRKAGLNVDTSQQFFATGTRMADVGYQTQAERKREHENMRPLREVAAELTDRVLSEQRHNKVITARDFGAGLTINGALKFDGYKLREQALRGLLLRLESPAAGYIFGVRDRMHEAGPGQKAIDKAAIVDTLQRECSRYPDVELNLRMRDGLGDIFACVSPAYGEADAPAVLPHVVDALRGYSGAKGTSSYDPSTTAWEVRAQVHTPTPTELQAVGEPFQGYVSARSRDNGTGRLLGGGGIELIRCLNAMVYVVDGGRVSRVHRGRIMIDLGDMMKGATKAISALCEAWGLARLEVIELPKSNQGKLIPIEEALPGFYRFMLSERRGDLVGVLPGRTATHAQALAKVYLDQRRDMRQVTRADLAQGFTRYIQDQPIAVQQTAEVAIADWLVKRPTVQYVQ